MLISEQQHFLRKLYSTSNISTKINEFFFKLMKMNMDKGKIRRLSAGRSQSLWLDFTFFQFILQYVLLVFYFSLLEILQVHAFFLPYNFWFRHYFRITMSWRRTECRIGLDYSMMRQNSERDWGLSVLFFEVCFSIIWNTQAFTSNGFI